MAKEVRLPRFGMTMESAEVATWLVAEGEFVARGEDLVELQNDKSVVAFESPESGFLHIVAREGEVLTVGDLLAVVTDAKDE